MGYWTEGTPDHPETPDELPGESAQHMTDRIDSVIAKIRDLQSGHVDKRNQGHDVGAKTCDVSSSAMDTSTDASSLDGWDCR